MLNNTPRPERLSSLIGSMLLLVVSMALALVVPISGLCRMAGFELTSVHPIFEHEHVQLADHAESADAASLTGGAEGLGSIAFQGLAVLMAAATMALLAVGAIVAIRQAAPPMAPIRVRTGPPRRRR